MVLVGFAFKVAAVPFHMWSPDAYGRRTRPPSPPSCPWRQSCGPGGLRAGFWHGAARRVLGLDACPLLLGQCQHGVGNVAALGSKASSACWPTAPSPRGYMLLGVMSGDVQAGARPSGSIMLTYLLMQSGPSRC